MHLDGRKQVKGAPKNLEHSTFRIALDNRPFPEIFCFCSVLAHLNLPILKKSIAEKKKMMAPPRELKAPYDGNRLALSFFPQTRSLRDVFLGAPYWYASYNMAGMPPSS